MAAPLVATQFVAHTARVTLYYFTSLGIQMFMVALVLFVFQGRRAEEIIPLDHQQAVDEDERQRFATPQLPPPRQAEGGDVVRRSVEQIELGDLARAASIGVEPGVPMPIETRPPPGTVWQILCRPFVLLMGLYLFLYVSGRVWKSQS